MSMKTTSTKQIMEESITWFSTPRLLAMQSMLVNCFHWHRRQQTWLGTGGIFRGILADRGWPQILVFECFWSILGLGSLYESLLSITHHGWWYMITTHEKHCESNRVHMKYRNIGTLQVAIPLVILFANFKITTRCVFQVHQPKEKLAFLEAARAQAMRSLSRKWQTS